MKKQMRKADQAKIRQMETYRISNELPVLFNLCSIFIADFSTWLFTNCQR